MYILLYVDDLIVAHKRDEKIAKLTAILHQHFDTKDFGYVTYYLGINLQHKEDASFLLNQKSKIEAVLQQIVMTEAKEVFPGHSISKNRRGCGSLFY